MALELVKEGGLKCQMVYSLPHFTAIYHHILSISYQPASYRPIEAFRTIKIIAALSAHKYMANLASVVHRLCSSP